MTCFAGGWSFRTASSTTGSRRLCASTTHRVDRALSASTLLGATVDAQDSKPNIRALLVDAAGTLISPSEPAAQVYHQYASRHGCTLTEREILSNFRRAFNMPWTLSTSRYVGDGRPFWRYVVAESTGCNSPELLEEIYDHYAQPLAWSVAAGAASSLGKVRNAGYRLAVVSNFDTRLRPILGGLGLLGLFDTVLVSAEVGVEKPNPLIFEAACERLGVAPHEALMLGDDRRNDVFGARDAGCYAWMWGLDVSSFDELARRLLEEEPWAGW